jgi:imidazolonepropionase-like amidohydrolase
MLTRVRGDVTSAICRSLAGVALFAQVLTQFAPLAELRDSAGPARVLAPGITTPTAATLAAQHDRAPPHNATTCPACIAQSLHARVESSVRLPALAVAEQAPTDRRTTTLRHHDPPSSHHSRAPPIVS